MNPSPFSADSVKLISDKDIVDCLESSVKRQEQMNEMVTYCLIEKKWAYYDKRNMPMHKGWTYSAINTFRGCLSELTLTL